jgi:nucleoid-associated protein YgaU
MIQRDLKIGLALGLVIVAGIVIKLATDPRLSTEARMMDLNGSSEGLLGIDSNNISENIDIIQMPFSTYSENQYTPGGPWQSQDSIPEISTQNERTDYSDSQNTSEQIFPPIREQVELPYTSEDEPEEVIKEPQRFHVVEKGQNLSKISSIYYGSPNQWRKIVDVNPDVIKNPDKIKPGLRLLIP